MSQLLLDFGEAPSLDEMQSAESRDELIILTDIDATISEEIAQA